MYVCVVCVYVCGCMCMYVGVCVCVCVVSLLRRGSCGLEGGVAMTQFVYEGGVRGFLKGGIL